MLDWPNLFDGTLPSPGLSTITVFLYRNAARKGKTANFTLDVAVTGDSGAPAPDDAGDEVAGGRRSGRWPRPLSARCACAPSRQPRRRNWPAWHRARSCTTWAATGPKTGSGAASPPWTRAWKAEAAAPASQDAPVSRTPFHAACEVPCIPAANAVETTSAFGVIRQGGGSGSVQSTLPDGTIRVLGFETGIPVAVYPATGEVVPP
jgi:hypothetical protein